MMHNTPVLPDASKLIRKIRNPFAAKEVGYCAGGRFSAFLVGAGTPMAKLAIGAAELLGQLNLAQPCKRP
jgi:hypothetical protein